ncbi:AMP-binding protein [Nocardiopsis sp. CNT312]|uniref:AMP-binding protein n=1 Tax=Nocardiopsis sp. CNT312 TaxID=1137268 RepID=UPI0004AE1DF5|nr:AMP-binding protein [Nocardiopsis sp. CNT312]
MALRFAGGSTTYAELVAAVRSSVTGGPPDDVRVVRADRDGRAVIDVLSAQTFRRPALLIPHDAGAEYTSRISRDLRSFTRGSGPLRNAHGLWTTTSGSTGRPKIVAHDPEGIDRFVHWARTRFALGADTVSLSLSPINFDIATLDVWAVLASGGQVVFASREDLTHGPALAAAARTHRISLLQAVPVVLTLLARARAPMPRVRTVVSTGDFYPLETLPDLDSAFPRAGLWSVYGSTETNDSFILDLRRATAGELGNPVDGVRYRVDGTGELVVSTPFQALGYVNAPNDAWRAVQGRREFSTGDLVATDTDGTLRLTGRSDRQVKVRGTRLSLDAVEAVLRHQSGVVDAVVTARGRGSGDRELLAAVRVEPGTAVTNLALRSAVSSALSPTAVPSRTFLTTEPFPVTGTGKTDRNSAIRRLLERQPT